MLNYLKENYGNQQSTGEAERMELEHLRSEVPALRIAYCRTASDRISDKSQSSSEDEDFVDDLPL